MTSTTLQVADVRDRLQVRLDRGSVPRVSVHHGWRGCTSRWGPPRPPTGTAAGYATGSLPYIRQPIRRPCAAGIRIGLGHWAARTGVSGIPSQVVLGIKKYFLIM